tara:strand:- start:5640 stop:7154 length:1515 start_codon:yes stop_codon:yes gene_type:complete
MSSTKAIQFLETLRIPTGPLAGRPVRLAKFQKRFIRGALKRDTSIAALSVARGGGKTMLSAGLALGHLIGAYGRAEPQREVLVGAVNADQAGIAMKYAQALARYLPADIQEQLIFTRSPRARIEFTGDGGGHVFRPIPAVGASILGASPTLVIMDERAAWPEASGQELEDALLSGALKRGGKTLMISTSAPHDQHAFSRWIDEPQPGVFVQEHRPEPGLPADDLESLKVANPGSAEGIGPKLEDLQAAARRAMARGGAALASFRNLTRNERVAVENRGVLITTEDWLRCETETLPPRAGPVAIGLDLGGSSSMSAACYVWPETGRLEALGWFPEDPSLLDRGARDHCGDLYQMMAQRGELRVLGARTVPVAAWVDQVLRHVENETVAAICADRFKASELSEGLDAAGIRSPVIWRGFGWKDGAEDIERFRRWAFDRRISAAPSLLLRSALEGAVTLIDPAGNAKLAKGKSTQRIDAAAAAVLAVAQASRMAARPRKAGGALLWA